MEEVFMFSWFSFLSYTVIMAYTPGPINIMSMNNAKNIGLRNSILFNLGNFVGHFVVMLACLAFSTALYTVIPQIQVPMKVVAAAYLSYLIIITIVPSKRHKTKEPDRNGSFLLGALLQLVNVKIMLFGITALTSYLLPCYKNIPILILFALLMSSIQLTGNIIWTLFGSVMNKLFNKHRTALNIIMAMMLLYCIVRLFV
jgi:cysteine/O-acetylserine efflux protein